MTGVHDQDAQSNKLWQGKIGFHQAAPAFFLASGHLGVAIARKIHQIGRFIHQKIVDMNGLSGGRAHIGQVLPLEHTIDHRGFAHITLSCERNLGHPVPWKLGRLRRGELKFYLLIIHAILTVSG